MNRRVARLRAVQALYQIDLTDVEREEAIQSVLDDEETPSPFMLNLLEGTLSHQDELDSVIIKSLQGWSLDRMGLLDRAIVRMILFEMQHITDIPVKVSLNEGIELAKAFGGEESGRFVNGVLSKALELIKEK